MEMIDIMYELANTKTALEAAGRANRKLRGKCACKNLVIAGLVWFGLTTCRMLGESEKKRKEAEDHAREAEAACAEMAADRDICCDGNASVTKKPE